MSYRQTKLKEFDDLVNSNATLFKQAKGVDLFRTFLKNTMNDLLLNAEVDRGKKLIDCLNRIGQSLGEFAIKVVKSSVKFPEETGIKEFVSGTIPVLLDYITKIKSKEEI